MVRTTIQIDTGTRSALHELKWRYRADTFDEVIRYLIAKVDYKTYQEFISEDLPDDPPLLI